MSGSPSAELWRWYTAAQDALGPDAPPALLGPILMRMCRLSDRLGYGRERRSELRARAVELARLGDDPTTLAEALDSEVFDYITSDQLEAALAVIPEALANARRSGDRRLISRLITRQAMATHPGNPAEGRRLFEEATALARATGDDRAAAVILLNRAEQEFRIGEARSAIALGIEAVAMYRRLQDHEGVMMLLSNIAVYYLWENEIDEGRTCAHEALTIVREAKSAHTVAFCVQHLAAAAAARGDFIVAAQLLGFSDARLIALDEPRQTTEQLEYDRLVATLEKSLEPGERERAQADGAAMPEEQAIAMALDV